jgi:hypothetical protein
MFLLFLIIPLLYPIAYARNNETKKINISRNQSHACMVIFSRNS